MSNLIPEVELSAAGLLRSLRLLKDEGRCQNIEATVCSNCNSPWLMLAAM